MRNIEETSLSHVGIAVCEQLYRSEHARILRLCHWLLMDCHEAEDVTQDVFLRLVRVRGGEQCGCVLGGLAHYCRRQRLPGSQTVGVVEMVEQEPH